MRISSRLLALTSIAIAATPSLFAADIVLQKVPPLSIQQAPAYPENLARSHFGAQVQAAPDAVPVSSLALSTGSGDVNRAEAALVCDDPTTGYALTAGDKTLLVTLSKIENIDQIAFLNRHTEGSVSIAISNSKLPLDSAEWHVVVADQQLTDNVIAKIGPSEAKYVRLTFKVSQPGRIASLGVYASPSVASFTMPRARKMNVGETSSFGLISYNQSDVHARSRAAYVSSGDDLVAANNMIDDQSTTTYTFAPNDPQPTAVIDLGHVTSLRRITAIYTPRPGTVNFYVLNALPGNGNAKTMKLDDAAFAKMNAVGSVTDGTGRAAIDFPETTGRYILVKWTGASENDQPFSIAEIAAFGGGASNLIAANSTDSNRQAIESDGKTLEDAKDLGGGKDLGKEMPEAVGEGPPEEGPPPPLNGPPPFSFVPAVLPASP